MHDGIQYDPIQGQSHKPLKFRNSTIFKGYNGGWQMTTDFKLVPKAYLAGFLIFVLVFVSRDLCVI